MSRSASQALPKVLSKVVAEGEASSSSNREDQSKIVKLRKAIQTLKREIERLKSNEKKTVNDAVGQTTRKELGGLTQKRRNYRTLDMNQFKRESFAKFFVVKIEGEKRKMNSFQIQKD